MRKALLIIGIAGGHWVLSMMLLLSAMGSTMGRMDGGGLPDLRERAVGSMLDVLLFPLVQPLGTALMRFVPRGFPLEHAMFVANSLLWAMVLVTLARRQSARRVPGVPPNSIQRCPL
jgi:hypothetical protein